MAPFVAPFMAQATFVAPLLAPVVTLAKKVALVVAPPMSVAPIRGLEKWSYWWSMLPALVVH